MSKLMSYDDARQAARMLEELAKIDKLLRTIRDSKGVTHCGIMAVVGSSATDFHVHMPATVDPNRALVVEASMAEVAFVLLRGTLVADINGMGVETPPEPFRPNR